MPQRIRIIFNWLAFVVMIATNVLANMSAFNDLTTGEVSARYPNLFVPSGYTFSIWGLIYFLLLGFLVYGSISLKKNRPVPATIATIRISPMFQISCMFNAGWIFAWHYLQVALSVIIMICFLLLLINIYLNLQPFRMKFGSRDYLWIYLPFVVYLGWISVATIANTTAMLVDKDWNGFGIADSYWSYIMISVAALLGLLFSWRRKDWAYGLVIIWAISGIWSAQHQEPGFNRNVPLMAMAILFSGIILSLFRKNKTTG